MTENEHICLKKKKKEWWVLVIREDFPLKQIDF